MLDPLYRVAPLVALVLVGGCRNDHVAPVRPLLTEVTNEVGLGRDREPWPDGSYFLPEIMGPGVALLDYDDDGDLDIYQLRLPPPGQRDLPAPNRLFQRRADGSYVDVTARSGLGDPGFGQGVAVADVDNDGDRDVYVANFGPDALYLNEGDGTFEKVEGPPGFADDRWTSSATFCDYDRDGWLDLYVVNYLVVDYDGPCRTNAGVLDYCGPQTFRGEPDRLYRNNGDGRFTDVTLAAGIRLSNPERAKGLGVICLDFTGDDRADIYVANDGEANQLWVNRGDGTFRDEALLRGVAFNRHGKAEASMGVAVGDVDRSGSLDLFMTHLTQENNTLFLGGSDSLFMDRTVELRLSRHDLLFTGFGCGLFDMDLDGDLDLAVANGGVRRSPVWTGPEKNFWDPYAEVNLLFENVDGSGFERVSDEQDPFASTKEVSRAMAFGDLDLDGDLDVVVSNVDNTLRVFRNDAPPADHHWLVVRALTGDRDAIGARVTATAGGERQVGFVQPGYSYQSSNDARAHFGLGKAERVDALDVIWPSGAHESFAVSEVDRVVTVRQGRGEPR